MIALAIVLFTVGGLAFSLLDKVFGVLTLLILAVLGGAIILVSLLKESASR